MAEDADDDNVDEEKALGARVDETKASTILDDGRWGDLAVMMAIMVMIVACWICMVLYDYDRYTSFGSFVFSVYALSRAEDFNCQLWDCKKMYYFLLWLYW